jgi:hypothetical protein
MNRADALLYVKPRFDKLMLAVECGVQDDIDGYGPALDSAFQRYSSLNALSTHVMNTIVEADDEYGFTVLLNVCEYDLLIPFYAMQPDIIVDAPLTSVKLSQTYRALRELRDEARTEAAEFGYVDAALNSGGFVLDLAHNAIPDPAHREFG